LNANVLFCRCFFESHAVYDQNSGFWCCVFLAWQITLLCTHFLTEWNHQSFKACSKVEPHVSKRGRDSSHGEFTLGDSQWIKIPICQIFWGMCYIFTFHLDWPLSRMEPVLKSRTSRSPPIPIEK
jgi:hypothetical protein